MNDPPRGHVAKPEPVGPSDPATLVPPAPFAPGKRAWWQNWRVMLFVWLVIVGLVWIALEHDVDRRVIAGSVFVVGMVSNAFAWLLSVIALVPVVGPLIAKALSIGFIWILNGVGWLVSLVAIKRGYSRDVLTYRGVTISIIIGIVIGYVLGKLV